MMPRPIGGWVWFAKAAGWHYIIDNESLCSRWVYFGKKFERRDDSDKHHCRACRRLLAKRADPVASPQQAKRLVAALSAVRTVARLNEWIEDSQPGEILCYWEGFLVRDRKVSAELDALAAALYDYARSGHVELTQDLKYLNGYPRAPGQPGRPSGLPVYVYIARRRAKIPAPSQLAGKAAMMAGSSYGQRNRVAV